MSQLSSPLTELKPHYDVIVIGSGYGGSISAARLARARKPDGTPVRVCLLERGKEIATGRFPNTLLKAGKEMQVDSKLGHLGDETGLYDFRQNDDISVFQGCGLGGTSLVNANVSLPVEDWVLDDPRWPKAFRDDRDGGLKAGYDSAKRMLRPTPYPNSPVLKKNQAHKVSAEKMGKADCFYNPPINVTFESGLNPVGVHQDACTGCGDCVTGCNVGSKNTLMTNYLPDARNAGAEIFCGVKVRRVARQGDRWLVYYQPAGADREKFHGPELFVAADVVVLSAGTLGSAEVMLRSKAAGLSVSDQLGKGFTGNGDVLGFGYNNDHRINGIGAGDGKVNANDPVGPCITGIIDLRKNQANPEDGFVIEEGSIPGALAPILGAALKTAADLSGQDTDEGFWDKVKEEAREWRSLPPGGAYHGAVANTQTYLIMSHDDGRGRLELKDDRVRVVWPNLGQQEVFRRTNKALYDATAAHGGTYVPSPMFTKAFGYDLVTVHPLGGCAMGEEASSGVVNHKGQVFSGTEGDAVYSSLYISDGSVMPRPLGVNPLLTISAVAERNVSLLARDRSWTISEELREGRARFDGTFQKDDRLRIQFTERMAGHCSTEVLDDYEKADADGKAKDQKCSFLLTIISEDLDRMIDEKDHEAGMIGTVEAPALSSQPLTVSEGRFNLFRQSEEEKTKKMEYRFKLSSVEGEQFYFDGFKVIKDDKGADVWSDTTTLFITIHKGGDSSGEVVARGKLYIAQADFAKQMTTMQARDSEGETALRGTVRFGRFFAGELWDTYGAESLG